MKSSTVLHRACYYIASLRVCTTIQPPSECTPLKIYSNIQPQQNVLHHPAPFKMYPNTQLLRIYYNMKPAQNVFHYPDPSKYTALCSLSDSTALSSPLKFYCTVQPLRMYSTLQVPQNVLHYAATLKCAPLYSPFKI